MKKGSVVKQRRRSNSLNQHKHGNVFVNVALMSGDEVVAVDEHAGYAGAQPKDNEYRIRVRKRVESPRWLFSFDLSEKVNSKGVITFIRK